MKALGAQGSLMLLCCSMAAALGGGLIPRCAMLSCTPWLRLRKSDGNGMFSHLWISEVAWPGMAIREAVPPHLPTQEGYVWRRRHPNRAANCPRS